MNYRGKMYNRIIGMRARVLGLLLNLSGFKNIRGHWVFTNCLSAGGAVIDLGCNEGIFSKEVTALYGSHCRLVEANSDLIHAIKVPETDKFNYAISNSDGVLNFFISANSEASSVMPHFQQVWGQKSCVEVQCVKWKTLIKKMGFHQHQQIEILKIDIEGAELDLIDNFDAEDIKTIVQISAEFHDWINPSLHNRTVDSIKKLIGLGFSYYTTSPSHQWPLEIVFVNQDIVRFGLMQKIYLGLFKKLCPISYDEN